MLRKNFFHLGIFIGVLCSGVQVFAQTTWPFDQRQIALIQPGGTTTPDEKTLAQVMDAFVRLGRVRWVSAKAGPGNVVPIEVPSDFPWQSAQAVRKLGLRYKVDGMASLMQKGVQLHLHWYATSDGQPLFFESLVLPASDDPAQEKERRQRLLSFVESIWSKIPGQGYLVKRDLKTVRLEGATAVALKPGDSVELRRLLNVERHPLLKTLVGISSSPTGRARVVSVEDGFAVANIEYESQIDPIQEGDRYQVIRAPQSTDADPGASQPTAIVPPVTDAEPSMEVGSEGRTFVPLLGVPMGEGTQGSSLLDLSSEPKYRVLDVSGALSFSSISYQETVSGDTTAKSLSALSPGFSLDVLAYLTRDISLISDLHFGLVKFGDATTVYGVDSVGSGLLSFRVAGAYRFIFQEDAFYPGALSVSLGFRRLGLSMTQFESGVAPTSKAYSGMEFGLGVTMPVMAKWGLSGQIQRGVGMTLVEQQLTSGAEASNSVWEFTVRAHHRFTPSSDLYFGLTQSSATTNFTGTGTRTTAALSSIIARSAWYGGYLLKF